MTFSAYTRPVVAPLRTLCAATLLLGPSGCGGSSTEAKSADNGDATNSETSSGDSGSTGDSEGVASEAPQGPDCSDGTCFECGDGICPKGAYCDQNAEGGAACAWLPECSGSTACSCIIGVLKDCSCDEASGGPIVSCQ